MGKDPERIDPEAEGIPSVADDTSTAYDEPEPRMRPDEQPPLPVDKPDRGVKRRPGGVGRLVEPDLGGIEDTEAQAIATDTGELSGQSAEEAAMHLEPPSPGNDDEEIAADEGGADED
jgi:Family of unknown function (DUF5709)